MNTKIKMPGIAPETRRESAIVVILHDKTTRQLEPTTETRKGHLLLSRAQHTKPFNLLKLLLILHK